MKHKESKNSYNARLFKTKSEPILYRPRQITHPKPDISHTDNHTNNDLNDKKDDWTICAFFKKAGNTIVNGLKSIDEFLGESAKYGNGRTGGY